MSPTTVRQSIEALYQEAEAVVAEGGAMLAIVKSTPANPAAELQTIAAIHAEARSTRSSDDDLPLKERIKNLLAEADAEWDSSQPPSGEYSEQQPANTEQAIVGQTASSPANNNTIEDSQKASIEPVEPPAPAPSEAQDMLPQEEVDSLVSQAQADVHAVMADIAAAVGTVPVVESGGTPAGAAQNDTISMDRQTLQTLIRDTVKSVVAEELPKIVTAAMVSQSETQVVDLKPAKRAAKKATARKAAKKTAGKTAAKAAKKTKAKAAG